MSRRGRRGVAISLFSFQDIITCVSGIIIILVLLLALELVERRAQGHQAARTDVTRLEAALAGAEAALEQRRAESGQADDLLRDLADASPVELRLELDRTRASIDSLQREAEELRGRGKRLQDEHKTIQVKWFENKQTARELEELRRRREELQRRIEKEREEDRPIYTVPRGTKLAGWLVLVEEGTITVARLGRAGPPIVFRGRTQTLSLKKDAVDQFLGWARGQPKSSAYFLLVVRSSGLDEFDKLEPHLTNQGYRYGFDLAGLDQTIVDPERGAGE